MSLASLGWKQDLKKARFHAVEYCQGHESFWGKITRKICKLACVNYNKNDAFNHQEHLSYIHLLSFLLAQDLQVDQPQ